MVKDCLRSASRVNDRLGVAGCLEISAWISGRKRDARRAAVLLGAARVVGGACIVSPQLLPHHARCEQQARRALGDRAFEAAYSNGWDTCVVDAVAFALGETRTTNQDLACSDTTLTRRERQVAQLVSKGMTNRAIASELVISQRTAQGHVEHILTKLGFNSRSQIAAWIVEQEYQSATPNQTLPTRRTGFGPGEQRAS
ncbi:response regulator transcription factor [Rhodococcus sp. NPDC059968]|uniref:helix-turn-helix transcriptional regulator n=1 Tax=Rhodococcus sp. NPDC059968 TaxID=3347017 RepID=UPI00367182E9